MSLCCFVAANNVVNLKLIIKLYLFFNENKVIYIKLIIILNLIFRLNIFQNPI